MTDLKRSLGAALLILIALLLTFKLKAVLGWSPDLVVPVLAVVAFFLDLYPLALFTLLAAWILDWQPGVPPELWVVAAAPFAAKLGKRFLPSKPWVTLAVVIGAAEFLIYLFATGDAFGANLGFILSNVAFAVFFGLALMRILEYVYGEAA